MKWMIGIYKHITHEILNECSENELAKLGNSGEKPGLSLKTIVEQSFNV